MWYHRLIIACIIFVTSLAMEYSFARASDMCDFYDRYGMYVLSFDKNIKLGRSGASITSGISFVFSDDSTLSIIPGIEVYDPKFSEPGEDTSIPDDMRFILEFAKNDCKISKAKILKGTTITCDKYEYSILELNNKPYKIYITVYYDFISKKSWTEYENVLQSLVAMPSKSEEVFNEIIHNAIGGYYFSQDEKYRRLVEEYEQPYIACGKYRARSELLQFINNKTK